MGRIFQRPASHTEYTLENGGWIKVDNLTHTVTLTVGSQNRDLLGTEVYASKGKLTNVETGKVIALYTTRRKVHIHTTT